MGFYHADWGTPKSLVVWDCLHCLFQSQKGCAFVLSHVSWFPVPFLLRALRSIQSLKNYATSTSAAKKRHEMSWGCIRCEKMVSPYSRPWNSDSNMHGSHTRQISKQEIAGHARLCDLLSGPEMSGTLVYAESWYVLTYWHNKVQQALNNPSWKEDV